MKKFLGMCLVAVVLLLIFCPCVCDAEMPVAYGDEDAIWSYICERAPNDHIAAGVMGFFYRESRLKANSVAGWPQCNIGFDYDICEKFVSDVDAGLEDGSTKEMFVQTVNIHYGGYGLGQWSNVGYLEHFYDFMSEHGDSIGDEKLQCEFIFESMMQNERLWKELLECQNAAQCGRRIGYLYDGTNALGAETISDVATYYYRKFHEE